MTSTATAQLTRAEDAYAHLASFQRGDAVDVAGEEFFMPGVITGPQRNDGDDLTAAYVTIGGDGAQTRISVASLLDGMTVTLQNEVARGNVRYFDQAGYAAQHGEDCDECGAYIPDGERYMVNGSHEESCSLHPASTVG